MVNSMLIRAKLPLSLWGEALLAACHILNRIPSKKYRISPYETWRGRKPNLGYLKVWGCLAYCRTPDPKRTKLGPRAIKCAFVGYAQNSKAYRLLDMESNTIIESRDVEFFENSLSLESKDNEIQTPNREPDSTTPQIVEDPIEPRRSQRTRIEKSLSGRSR